MKSNDLILAISVGVTVALVIFAGLVFLIICLDKMIKKRNKKGAELPKIVQMKDKGESFIQEQSQKPCPKCNSNRTEIKVGGFGGQGGISFVNPSIASNFFRTKNISNVSAFMCTSCGYTELYATDIKNLLPKEVK